jgi:hypothetical protein
VAKTQAVRTGLRGTISAALRDRGQNSPTPTQPRIAYSDVLTALHAAVALLAGLRMAEATGQGQHIEVPMFDAVLAFNLVEHLSRAAIPGEPAGYGRVLTSHRGPHRTIDGYVAMLPYTDKQRRALFTAVGREELLEEPWYTDNALRLRNFDDKMRSIPGVQAVSVTLGSRPMIHDSALPFWIEGEPKPPHDNDMHGATFFLVESGFQQAMGITLLRGRFVSDPFGVDPHARQWRVAQLAQQFVIVDANHSHFFRNEQMWYPSRNLNGDSPMV